RLKPTVRCLVLDRTVLRVLRGVVDYTISLFSEEADAKVVELIVNRPKTMVASEAGCNEHICTATIAARRDRDRLCPLLCIGSELGFQMGDDVGSPLLVGVGCIIERFL